MRKLIEEQPVETQALLDLSVAYHEMGLTADAVVEAGLALVIGCRDAREHQRAVLLLFRGAADDAIYRVASAVREGVGDKG